MERLNNDSFNFGHSFYGKYIQDDENMQAKVKAILNQIQENRVIVKELHIEYGIKFCEIITSYQNRLRDISEHYDNILQDLISRREEILKECEKVLTYAPQK